MQPVEHYANFKASIIVLQDSNVLQMKKKHTKRQNQTNINTIPSAYKPLEKLLKKLNRNWSAPQPDIGLDQSLLGGLALKTKGVSFDISAANQFSWTDWFNFLYATRNVAAHGDSYRTLVHGCLPPQKRADFTASLIQIKNDFSATKEQKDWAEDMLRLLRWMERDLNNQNPYHADDSLSYATLLWLPKLSKLLAHRAWIATVGTTVDASHSIVIGGNQDFSQGKTEIHFDGPTTLVFPLDFISCMEPVKDNNMQVESKTITPESSPDEARCCLRHLLLIGTSSPTLHFMLADYIDEYKVMLQSHGSCVYALCLPKASWTTPLHFNVPSLCWDDQMSFYLVMRIASDGRKLVAGVFETITSKLPSAAVSRNDHFIIYGFDGSKEQYDSIDVSLFPQLPHLTILVPSYPLLNHQNPPNRTRKLNIEWAISLPDEEDPTASQVDTLSNFGGFHNLIRFVPGVGFLLTGVKKAFRYMYRKTTVLKEKLGTTTIELLLYCNDGCKTYRKTKYDSSGGGSKYRCQTCGGWCKYLKVEK